MALQFFCDRRVKSKQEKVKEAFVVAALFT